MAPYPKTVFLSCSHEDHSQAREICEELTTHGFDVFAHALETHSHHQIIPVLWALLCALLNETVPNK